MPTPPLKNLGPISAEVPGLKLKGWERLSTVWLLTLVAEEGVKIAEDFLGRRGRDPISQLAEITRPIIPAHATEL